MNIALILQIIQAALQLAPFAVETIAGIKALLASDPTVPDGLKAILAQTVATDQETLSMIQAWVLANPATVGQEQPPAKE